MNKIYNQTDSRSISKCIDKHSFSPRLSLLDLEFEGLKHNLFKGIYNLLVVIVYAYLIGNPLLRYKTKGEYFDPYLIQKIEQDISLCLLTWPLFYIWSHMAFLIQLKAKSGANENLVLFCQHFSQILLFLCTHYLVFSKKLFISHGLYISFQACVFMMKMQSYNDVNNQFRRQNDPQYPKNINLWNFNLYLWMPVLVYQPTYPRNNQKIRISYLFRKLITSLTLIWLCYVIVSDKILPIIKDKYQYSLIENLSSISLPVICVCLSVFVMLFENYLQFFAEITQFSDRLFYFDWWNSNGIEEFNRKWNRPVHMFLHKHVYTEAINFGINKQSAQLITIAVSAFLHEFCIAVALQQIRPILLFFMIFQIPIFVCIKYFKITILESNTFMWFSLILGVPLLTVLYIQIPQ